MEFVISDIDKVAKDLAQLIQPGDIVLLSGELAAGKTTLSAAIAKALGFTGRVSSPTYVLEHRYKVSQPNLSEVVHLDFYRLSEEQLDSFDWQDTLGQKDTITLIEWPERLGEKLPKDAKKIKLEIVNDNTRRLTLSDNFSS